MTSSLVPPADKDRLDRALRPADRRQIFEELGFQIGDQTPGSEGWIGGILGPAELGEGEEGNFSVNVETGGITDHGSPGWSGDLYQAVIEVRGVDFPEALRWVAEVIGYEAADTGKNADWDPFADGQEVESYRYVEEEGTPVYEVVRFEAEPGHPAYPDKTFLQRRIGPNGGTDWGLGDAPGVLYQLPEVQRAIEEGTTIFLVEGEKDVHTLEDCGFVATTNPMGAGKWRSAYTKQLNGADVVIIPDRDEAGLLHAYQIAERLEDVANTIRIVHLPGLEEGGDVTDWLEAGTEDEFVEVVQEAPSYEAGAYRERLPAFDGILGGKDSTVTVSDLDAVIAESPEQQVSATNHDGNDGNPSSSKGGTNKHADELIALAEEVEVFTSPQGQRYASFPVNGHWETRPIDSEGFRFWLRRRFWDRHSTSPSSQAISDATDKLAADAFYSGRIEEVATRVAEGPDGRIYLDLCNEEWEVVRIGPDGWEMIQHPPVYFRRSGPMEPLPRPNTDGSIEELRAHTNAQDRETWMMIVAWLVAALRPSGPYPVLRIRGEQGSAKSTTARMLRRLIDPSAAPLRSPSGSKRDLMITAQNSRVIAFDNVSGLRPWMSDAICSMATGAGFATRALHTDDEEMVFEAMRPVLLNGIDEIAQRDDLAERTLSVNLEAIPPGRRKTERELHKAFEEARPGILGALCGAVSCALRRIDAITLENPPRMADFAEWIVAAEPALPWAEGDFMEIYDENRQGMIVDQIETHPLARGFAELIELNGPVWRGTPGELYGWLTDRIPESEQDHEDFPGGPNWITRRLDRVRPMLRKGKGITIETGRGSDGRYIEVRQDADMPSSDRARPENSDDETMTADQQMSSSTGSTPDEVPSSGGDGRQGEVPF